MRPLCHPPMRINTLILHELIQAINSFHGKASAEEIPLETVKSILPQTCEDLKKVTGCGFLEVEMFRIQVFITIAMGAGLMKPGPHLHQLAIPVPSLASRKHLQNPGSATSAAACRGCWHASAAVAELAQQALRRFCASITDAGICYAKLMGS